MSAILDYFPSVSVSISKSNRAKGLGQGFLLGEKREQIVFTHKLGNRRYAAILADQKCKQTRLHASCEYGILLDGRLWKQKRKR